MMEMGSVLELLRWHISIGADEAIGDVPVDRFSLTKATSESALPPSAPKTQSLLAPCPQANDEFVKAATDMASQASDVFALLSALESFEGCGLKKTATNLVFFEGLPLAKIMLISEAPGAQEDRKGTPFAGPNGVLLDKMLSSIEVKRSETLISNTVFWRPPGNRSPTEQEIAICLPFIERLIELVHPKILIILGGPAAKSLLGESQGIGRLRGRWFNYKAAAHEDPIDTTVMFNPNSLLKTPSQKRAAWHDLLTIKEKLKPKLLGNMIV
jgi:uracil-DNA glycosylase family 4